MTEQIKQIHFRHIFERFWHESASSGDSSFAKNFERLFQEEQALDLQKSSKVLIHIGKVDNSAFML